MHVIRLRAPWDIESSGEQDCTVRCSRSFNLPTGLDGSERVWLVIEGLICAATVSLNGAVVGQAPPLSETQPIVRFDITPLLEPRNKIEFDIASPPSHDPLKSLGEVRLEIG